MKNKYHVKHIVYDSYTNTVLVFTGHFSVKIIDRNWWLHQGEE